MGVESESETDKCSWGNDNSPFCPSAGRLLRCHRRSRDPYMRGMAGRGREHGQLAKEEGRASATLRNGATRHLMTTSVSGGAAADAAAGEGVLRPSLHQMSKQGFGKQLLKC